MSTTTHSRYLQNNLQPAALDDASLQRIRDELRLAVFRGIEIIESQSKQISEVDDSIYVGTAGIALMYLRLIRQKNSLNLSEEQEKFVLGRARAYLSAGSPSRKPVRSGRLSPLDSALGVAFMRVILQLNQSTSPEEVKIQEADIDILEQAIVVAKQDDTGTNEVLYGKAGLLYALCQLHGALGSGRLSGKRLEALTSDQVLQFFADKLIEEGKKYTSQGIPLCFEWHGTYYIGTIHGIAGIVTVLLQCPSYIIEKHRDVIIQSIKYICLLVQQNEGHLPPSLPVMHRSDQLLQICHGTPGYLLLLATLKKIYPDWLREIEKDVDLSVQSASDVIWKEGLLYKGINICHGVTGNAWPWLLMASTNRGDNEEHLARALAFVQHAIALPPMPVPKGITSPYRTPDRPYSLFEGLAGAVCCWSETCAIISARLGDPNSTPLGFPGVGGVGITGML